MNAIHTHRMVVLLVGIAWIDPPVAWSQIFEDVTAAAGLTYVHWVPQSGDPIYCTEIPYMLGGAAAGDYDNDGWVDLFVTRIQMPNLLFRNLGNGSFEEVGAAAGIDLIDISSGCAWGDINNDGFLDLYVLTVEALAGAGRNYLYLNDGMGHFTEIAVERGVEAACTNCRHHSTSATFGDYDLDGDLDLHVVEWWFINPLNRLLRNDGAGFFSDVTVEAGVEMPLVWGFSNAFADMDNDGWPDLLVAADFGTSQLYRNLGNGGFVRMTPNSGTGTDENGMGSSLGDYDNDGDLDWFVTSIYDPAMTCDGGACSWGASGNRLYRNETGVTFSDHTDIAGVRDGGWGWGAAFFDCDNDGDLDLGMTNGVDLPCQSLEDPFNTDPLRLWQNDGSGIMTEVSNALQFTDTGSGKGFVTLDYDNDGDLDVFIANNAASPILFRNNGGNDNNWLTVSLRGSWTNYYGLGARVLVQINEFGPTQMREINNNSNYLSHNEAIAHFGLGPGVTSIFRLQVLWPASGLSQEFLDAAPNQHLVIQEPNPLKGDVNLDGTVDPADIGDMVLVLLGSGSSLPIQQWAADMNDDLAADGADITMFVNLLLAP